MKLTLVGGGGVRAPLFIESALRRAEWSNLTELCLLDIDGPRLELFGGLGTLIARQMKSPVRITTSLDPERALDGAAYVVTTVRPGLEEGRIKDERIALAHGVLGQETTGPGGFAMALRSIPTILGYADLLKRVSPDAWLFNFTNPAGLVTQALRDAGHDRSIGICDGANAAQSAVARWYDVPEKAVRTEVFGLNHLSFTRRAEIGGEDVLPRLLADDAFLAASAQKVFSPRVVRRHGMWINEYLYYFYYAEKAVDAIRSDSRTRGEEILDLNHGLIDQLTALDWRRNPDLALRAYYAYAHRRNATYMHYAQDGAPSMEEADRALAADAAVPKGDEGEGYAGVALDLVDALETGKPLYSGLNVPNQGAIEGLRDEDVVEVSCVVDRDGVRPLPIGPMPEAQAQLVHAIKRYERLAVQAIRDRDRDLAVEALVAHPLVLSYSRAEALVDEYLTAHAPYVGNWQ
jgi:6-phospho-beta-glucosidase